MSDKDRMHSLCYPTHFLCHSGNSQGVNSVGIIGFKIRPLSINFLYNHNSYLFPLNESGGVDSYVVLDILMTKLRSC